MTTSSSISSAARVLLRDATRSILQNRSTSVVNRNFNSVRRTTCRSASIRTIPRCVSVTLPIASSTPYIIQSCNDSSNQFSTAAQQEVEDSTTDTEKDKEVVAASNEDAETTSTTISSSTKNGNNRNQQEEKKRQKISSVKISDVLKRKHTLRWVEPVISATATVREAITVCIDRKLNGMMVVDKSDSIQRQTTTELKQKCVGLITNRDILRIIASGIKDGKESDDILNEKIATQMTPINQVIYGRPDETIGQCRAIMAKLGIKCLPILSDGRVEGILTGRDFSDFYFDAEDLGGKKNYLRDVSERIGLTSNTSMAEPPVFVRQHLALKHAPLYMNVGAAEYPHPFKAEDGGIGSSRRNYGPQDLATDPELSEDAHFVKEVELLGESGTALQKLLYMGVGDGVGSWREYGVDPRAFSHKLMGECENILQEASSQCGAVGGENNCSMSK